MPGDYQGIVPYLFYDDVAAALDWYTRVFAFKELSRWQDDRGVIHNAEMRVGNTELWLDGSGRRTLDDARPHWVGVWVGDVDAMHRRVVAAGVLCEPPEDREFGVRMLNVDDGMGHLWGFMSRLTKQTSS